MMINRLIVGCAFLRDVVAGDGDGGGGGSVPAQGAVSGDVSRPSLGGGGGVPDVPDVPDVPGVGQGLVPAQGSVSGDVDFSNYLSSPESLAAYREVMGIPATAKDYSFDVGVEVDAGVKAVLQKAGVDYGISPVAMAGLVKDYMGAQEVANNEVSAERERVLDAAFGDLQKEWGQDFDAHCSSAAKAANALCRMAGVDTAVLREPGITDNPGLIRLFAKASELLSEGSAKGLMDKSQFSSSVDEARRIESDPTHPLHKAYMDVSDPMHAFADRAYNRAMGIS